MTAGGDKHDRARGIAVDRDGNVLPTGEFTRVATFGRHTAATRGSNDLLRTPAQGTETVTLRWSAVCHPAHSCFPCGWACGCTCRRCVGFSWWGIGSPSRSPLAV